MAYTTIKKPSDYFNTKLYTGNGGTNAITGVGFQPDWTWIKSRTEGYGHSLFDAVRGVTKAIASEGTGAEYTFSTGLTAFGSDGFTLGSGTVVNNNSQNHASWNWKANGAGSANTDGSISSTVSANTTSGFSIVSYTGTGSAGTVGHGLGSTPKMIIIKNITQVTDWVVGHQEADTSNPWNKYLQLNDPTVPLDSPVFNDTAPTNSVFSVGADGKTSSGAGSHIAYCFADVQGYSKFGSYTANGSTDGTFIYTGFKPAFFLAKRITNGTEPWVMFDNKRANPFNGVTGILKPNLSEAETTQGAGPSMDFLSNGIKFRNTDGTFNNSGIEFIYMAFAEQPLVGDNPATAR